MNFLPGYIESQSLFFAKRSFLTAKPNPNLFNIQMQLHVAPPKKYFTLSDPTLANSCDIVSDIPSGFTYGLGSSSITKFSFFFRPYILGIYGNGYLTVGGRQFDNYLTIIWHLFSTYLTAIWHLIDSYFDS